MALIGVPFIGVIGASAVLQMLGFLAVGLMMLVLLVLIGAQALAGLNRELGSREQRCVAQDGHSVAAKLTDHLAAAC